MMAMMAMMDELMTTANQTASLTCTDRSNNSVINPEHISHSQTFHEWPVGSLAKIHNPPVLPSFA